MIVQNEILKPYTVPSFRNDAPVKLRFIESKKGTEVGHTSIKIITHIEDFEALEQEWNRLVWESDTHIFQTFEWNRIWWRHFGNTKKLHIVAVFSGNKLAGIAPLFEDDITLYGFKMYSCLRFIGSYVSQPKGEPLIGRISYSDYLDFIIQPGFESTFYRIILQYFNDVKSEYDEIVMDEVSEKSIICNTMIPLIGISNFDISYTIEPASSSPVILLDSTWEEYLKSMNPKIRHHVRHYYNKSIEGDYLAFKIEKINCPTKLPGALIDFIQMHQQQWNNRGFAGTFSEKRMHDFFIEVATSFYEKGWIEINTAYPVESDTKYVAIDVILTFKNNLYLLHRGMNEDSSYRKLGPGNVLLYTRLNEAINDGGKVFDLLRGSEEFKLRMATKINQNKKIIIYIGKKVSLLPRLTKKIIGFIKQIRIEKTHFVLLFKGKSVLKGLTKYIQFLHRRIKHKLIN